MNSVSKLTRRRVLRGMMGGAAVSVGLPFLDCFLDSNGAALAAGGTALPVCFGTWFYGCGLNPGRWEPRTAGPNYEFGVELRPLSAFKSKINVYSRMSALLDGRPRGAHTVGPAVILQGTTPPTLDHAFNPEPSFDVLIADVIGRRSRFRSLEVSCTGNPVSTHSKRAGSAMNPAEVSPLALYTRIFGPEFKDPNAADFAPDAAVMARRSVLSAVGEQTKRLMNQLGAADRAHLDQYLTSLRELEQQLDLELQKPAPLAACRMPARPDGTPVGTEVAVVSANHRLFAKLLAHALACDQTRVFNIMLTDGLSQLRFAGEANTQHLFTHEDPIDAQLGYQPNVVRFVPTVLENLNVLLTEFDAVREGDKTLLDRMLVLAYTDSGYAKNHTTDNIPMLTAGSAGGRMKTGIHFAAPKGDPVTRVSLTVQQAVGLPVSGFGTESNHTSKTITEVMA
ncbi:MAG TPA: DUF1552 domain-containing protein [Steroidobacteraceae bacterium]|nr:DUF1552 domain-containing protein [Steroidobacteraceae bacterium]